MNAIEIRGLSKSFGSKQAVAGLDMTVPVGAIYGFIGQNGSGKSTTEKLICGLMRPTAGEIRLFGQPHTTEHVRARVGALIEEPGCYPARTVWDNMMLQAANLGLQDPRAEVTEALRLVHMEGAAASPYRACSLGMKQRVGLAMALLGHPYLLVLDEPINGLDADGMRIVREVLQDLVRNHRCTVLVSSHVLGELEKIATHYGIIKDGRMVAQMTAAELDASCRTYTAVAARDMARARGVLLQACKRVEQDEAGYLRVYDALAPEDIVAGLYANGVAVTEVHTAKIGLEEYYTDLLGAGARSRGAQSGGSSSTGARGAGVRAGSGQRAATRGTGARSQIARSQAAPARGARAERKQIVNGGY